MPRSSSQPSRAQLLEENAGLRARIAELEEAAQLKQEARWQFALEGAGEGVWDWDVRTNRVYYSPRWKAMLGYAEDEIGDTLAEWETRIHPDDQAQCRADLERHLQNQTPVYQNRHRVLCKDGTYKWILDRGRVFNWTAEGQPQRVVGTHTDLSELNLVPQTLQPGEWQDTILVNGIELKWDTRGGVCTFRGLPVAMMWVDTTLAGLMAGVEAMVGPERFALALQAEGRKSVESDWLIISRYPDFKDGFAAITGNAAVAGWGDWQLAAYDPGQRTCRFRVYNNWEGLYQKALGVCWGSGLLAGKLSGICSKLFDTNCWATQTAFVAQGAGYDEFVVTPSSRRIEDDIAALLRSDQATRADMAVALRELEHSQQALHQAAAYARSLLEASPDPLVTISAAGVITDVNRATEAAAGLPRERLIGSDFSSYFTEPEQARVGYQRVFAEGSVSDYPLALRHTSGRVMDVLYNASVYRDEAGQVQGVFAAARDITDRKRAEAEASRLARYARSLLEASLDPLVTIDAAGVITDVNHATELATGCPRSALIGSDFSSYFTEPERARQGYQRVFAEGAVTDYALALRSASGQVREVLYNASVYRDETGQVLGVLAAARDITERKRAEDEILRLNSDLEQRVAQRTAQLSDANRELEAFAYSVSHDLRAPLRAMEGFSTALLAHYAGQLDEQGRHYLDRIQQASQRMGQLISDLLNLSRVTRAELTRQPVDLAGLAREITVELQARDPQRRVDFVIADALGVQGDARLLRQALHNLLDNAWKFSGPCAAAVIEIGRLTLAELQASAAAGATPAELTDPATVIYYVRDNGVGFDMAYIGKLFAPFQRLHAVHEFPGTGIGLAIVQRIIARHGGRLWPCARAGQGATFYFTLGEPR